MELTDRPSAKRYAQELIAQLPASVPFTELVEAIPEQFRGYALSHCVTELAASSGYTNVKCVDGAGDGGVDIHSTEAVIQCKSARLTQSEVRMIGNDISSSFPRHREHIVVSLRGFADSTHLVKRSIKLWGPDELNRMARNYGRKSDNAEFDLLPHNAELRDQMLDALNANKSVFIGAATGTGKSMLAAYLIHLCRNGRVLYVAPTAAHSQIDATLQKHAHMTEMELRNITKTTYDSAKHYMNQKFDLLILDEIHQAGAPTRQEPVKQLIENSNWVLGLSATRWRTIEDDETVKHMHGVEEFLNFDEVLDGHDLPSATAHGIVKRIRYIRVVPNDQIVAMEKQLQKVKATISGPSEFDLGIDYQLTQSLMMRRMRAGRSVMFCATVKQARKRCLELSAEGIAAREYTSQTANAEENLAWFREPSGGAKVLVSCLKAAEAIHCTVDNVILHRVTYSYRLYLQMLGRAVKAGFAEGDDPHVFDVMNCVSTVPPRFSYVETVKRAIAEYDALRVEAGSLPLHTGFAPCAEEDVSDLMYRVIERAVCGATFEDVLALIKRENRLPIQKGHGERYLHEAAAVLRGQYRDGKLEQWKIDALEALPVWHWRIKQSLSLLKQCERVYPSWVATGLAPSIRKEGQSAYKAWREVKAAIKSGELADKLPEWLAKFEAIPTFTLNTASANRKGRVGAKKGHAPIPQFNRLRDKVFALTGIRHKTGKFKTATLQELEAILAANGLTTEQIRAIRYNNDPAKCGGQP